MSLIERQNSINSDIDGRAGSIAPFLRVAYSRTYGAPETDLDAAMIINPLPDEPSKKLFEQHRKVFVSIPIDENHPVPLESGA